MARAEVASASVSTDSIKGLAQSIAKPAYRRLLTAEPALRRAVPSLIIAFLVTVGIGAIVQVNDRHRQAVLAALEDIDAIADVAVDQLERSDRRSDFPDRALGELARAIPAKANASERYVVLSDPAGNLLAAVPSPSADLARNIPEILRDGGSPPPRIQTGAAEITLPDGTPALLTVRSLKRPLGQLLVIQPRAAALASWRSDTVLTVTLFATTGFVLLILGFAFHWQSMRAREADVIFDTVRSRIDTALNSGRCGLWDWDLARGRIFWSHSMFDILGLEPRDDLLTFGEVSELVHPDDVKLYELAVQLEANGSGCGHAVSWSNKPARRMRTSSASRSTSPSRNASRKPRQPQA
jgi:two-component system cell cycle sensor histidine kinase PleC